MAGQASIENGKKGGRRKGSKASHTLQAEAAKKIIIEKVAKAIEPLINALIKKGKAGDVQAVRELFDRAFGKVPSAIELPNGNGEIIIKWQNQ